MTSCRQLTSDERFLALVRKSWLAPLCREELATMPLPEDFTEDEVWDALTHIRYAMAFRSPQYPSSQRSFTDWHTVPEHLSWILYELDHRTRSGSNLDMLARERNSRAFVTQQYVEEMICNLQFDGYDIEYEDARAVLLEERPPLTDAERIAVNFHGLMHELPSLVKQQPLSVSTLQELYARLLADVPAIEQASPCRPPRSPLEEHYTELPDAGEGAASTLPLVVDIADGRGSDPLRHPIMTSMLVNCQFWRTALFPSCNNLMGCVTSRFFLTREGYPVFRYIPKIRILEKWKHGCYDGIADASYAQVLKFAERETDWTLYYDTIMTLMLYEVSRMERALVQKAGLDGEALEGIEGIPYLSHRQREVLREAVLVQKAEFTIAEHKKRYGVVYSTARADLEDLVERGLFDRIQRGQAFVYKAATGLRDNLRMP